MSLAIIPKQITKQGRYVFSRRGLLFSCFVALLLLSGCSLSTPQSTFDTHGPVARMQLDLFYVIFWAAVFVFVVVEGALLYIAFRFRRTPHHGTPSQVHGNTRLEIGWTIAPAIVLLVIAVPTIITQFKVSNPPTQEGLRLDVKAHQWWWEFSYPELGVVTANELHVPVGQVVKVTLQSEDVIHSFWIPKLAGKMDVIPTRANEMWFQADEEGTYLGQCAEFCGIAHALMRFQVVAESKEAFEKWTKAQKALPLPSEGLAAEGAKVFSTGACVACHTIEGTRAAGTIGPNLTHVGSRATIAAGVMENDLQGQSLAKWLSNPQAIKPGNKMPNLNLSDQQIKALVAYLQHLK